MRRPAIPRGRRPWGRQGDGDLLNALNSGSFFALAATQQRLTQRGPRVEQFRRAATKRHEHFRHGGRTVGRCERVAGRGSLCGIRVGLGHAGHPGNIATNWSRGRHGKEFPFGTGIADTLKEKAQVAGTWTLPRAEARLWNRTPIIDDTPVHRVPTYGRYRRSGGRVL